MQTKRMALLVNEYAAVIRHGSGGLMSGSEHFADAAHFCLKRNFGDARLLNYRHKNIVQRVARANGDQKVRSGCDTT